MVALHHGECAVVETNAGRVYIVRASELLKMQTGMRWIGPEQPKSAPGILLNFHRQIREQSPELPGSPQLDQSRLSNGRVSPLASSSRASRAMRRMISRFSAKRFFHASSELPGSPQLDQSRLSNGRVSPLASSSRASRAMRRMISRFSAKRFFHAS